MTDDENATGSRLRVTSLPPFGPLELNYAGGRGLIFEEFLRNPRPDLKQLLDALQEPVLPRRDYLPARVAEFLATQQDAPAANG